MALASLLGAAVLPACQGGAATASTDAGAVDTGPPLPTAYRACASDRRDPEGGFCDATERWGVRERFSAPPEREKNGLKGVMAVADFDGDGRPDIWASIGASLRPVLLLNRGGRFENANAAWGLDESIRAEACAAADLDGDGDQDLITGGGEAEGLEVQRNDGGRFSPHAPDIRMGAAGLSAVVLPTDLDADGRLDLVAGIYRVRGACMSALPTGDCPGAVRAVRQTGPMEFSSVPVELPARRVQGLMRFDWDDDGADELLVAADFGMFDGANAVLRIDRSGGGLALRDATAGTGFDVPMFGMGMSAIDVDGDGRDELHLPNIGRCLLLQRSAGRARDVAVSLGADAYGMSVPGSRPQFRPFDPNSALEGPLGRFSAAFLDESSPQFPTTKWPGVVMDYDDDGIDDLFVPAGGLVTEILPLLDHQQSTMLRGTGRRLVDVTAATGMGNRRDVRVAAATDLDGDLDLDLVLFETAVRGRDGGVRILRNDASTGRSLTVVARGRGGARDGIDALVTLRVGSRTTRRRMNGNLSLFGSAPHELHFGLGAATEADEVIVRFASGATVRRERVPAGRVVIEE